MLAFVSDLLSAAFFESWGAAAAAVVLFLGSCTTGLLVVPNTVARPALRALAGMPLFFMIGGAAGILVYLLGGTVRHGLVATVGLSLSVIVMARWRARATGGFFAVARNDWKRELAVLGGLLLIGFLIAFFGWGETKDGTVRAMSGAWGDGALHTLIAEAFHIRQGGDLSMPAFHGELIREPFGYDFVAGMLRSAGFTVGGAFTLPTAGLLACLLGWSGYLAAKLARERPLLSLHRESVAASVSARPSRDGRPPRRDGQGSSARFAATIASVLLLTFGGFQWAVMAARTHAWSPERFFGVHQPTWDKVENLGLIWANHANTYVSQRHLLLAAAFLVVLAAMLLRVVQRIGSTESGPGSPAPLTFFASPTEAGSGNAPSLVPRQARDTVAARSLNPFGASGFAGPDLILFAVATGLLPLFHMHAFIAAALLWGAAALVTRSRVLLVLGVLALAVAAPTILWLSGLAGREGFLAFMPGWLSTGGLLGWIWFWALNLGAFIPLVTLAVWRTFRRDRASTLLLALPAVALFLLANLIRFQPYAWDNYKLFHLALLLVLPLAAAEMARWRFRGAWVAVTALVLLMSLTTLSELATHAHFRAAHPVYTPAHRAAARALAEALPPDAVVLAPTDTVHNHPLTLTGRNLVSGYGGWVWTRHYDWEGRADFIRAFRAADPARQCALARQLGVTHVVEGAETVRPVARAC